MGERRKIVSSLGDLQKLLDVHASEKMLEVRVEGVGRISEATSVREILRHQEAAKGWILSGMDGLEALVVVDEMIGDASRVLIQAIANMEVIVAASTAGSTAATYADSDSDADAETPVPASPNARRLANADADPDAETPVPVPASPSARRLANDDPDADPETPVPVPASPSARRLANADPDPEIPVPVLAFPSASRLAMEDTETAELARRMIEAGLGLCGGPLVPCAALLDLATRTLGDEGPSGDIDLSADTAKSGPAVRSVDAAKHVPAVCGLGMKHATDDSPTAKLAPGVHSLGAKGVVDVAIDDMGPGELVPAVAADMTDRFITFGAEDDSVDIDDQGILLALAERMLEAGTGRRGIPGPAIRRLAKRVLAADVIPTFDITGDDGIAPAPAADLSCLDDFKTMKLADRMLEAGTGRRGPPCIPSPAMLQLAARVVAGDSPPRDLTDTARHVFTVLLDSGTSLRHHRLGSSVIQRSVQSLGARMEDLATAVLISRHPPASLLQFLHTLHQSLIALHESSISPHEFSLL